MDTSLQTQIVVSSLTFLLMALLSDACSCLPPKHPQEHFCDSDFVIRAYVESRTENLTTYSALYHVQVLDILKQPENLTLFGDTELTGVLSSTDKDELEPVRQISINTQPDDVVEKNVSKDGTSRAYDEGATSTWATPSEGNGKLGGAVLHTGLWSSLCGVHLNLRSIYIIGGQIVDNNLMVGLCGLHIEDDGKSLNKRQKAGFFRKYRDNCDCKIRYCTDGRCPPDDPNQCSVNSKLSFTDFMNCANRYSMCRRRQGKCQWTKNRMHMLCQNKALRKRYFTN